MKAAIVTPYYPPEIGGLEIFAHQLNLALEELHGWDIVVVTSNAAGWRAIVDTVDGLKIYRLGTWLRFSNTPLNPLWPLLMRRIFSHEQPDVILAHTPVPSMADAARLAAGKTPLIVIYHAATLLKGDSPIFDLIARLYQLYERMLLNRANLICAVSGYVKDQFAAKIRAKTRVLANAVWERQIVGRQQGSSLNFLFVGSLNRTHAWKGLMLVIDAIAYTRARYGDGASLTVMGDGDDRVRYEQYIAQMGLNQYVNFLGNKTGTEKDAEFSKAVALVVYPTSSNDAFPTVMLEAWARGVPVIAASIGPMPSLITDGQDGYLVQPRNAYALADKLHKVAHLEPQQRQEVADNALQRTRQHYTWERQAELIDMWVKELLS